MTTRARKKIQTKLRKKFHGKIDRHHWKNKCNGGQRKGKNVSLLKIKKHRAWHEIFHNKSLEEAIEFLVRFKRYKDR